MGHTVNSIFIKAPYSKVFDVSNHIERWTELFGDEYVSADVLKRENNEITFRLSDDEGKSWVSKRWLYKDLKFAYASRHDPMFPFQYMKIIWLYHETSDGTLMTWIQDFTMDASAKFNDEQVEGFINEHSRHNLKIFKSVIEKEANEVERRK